MDKINKDEGDKYDRQVREPSAGPVLPPRCLVISPLRVRISASGNQADKRLMDRCSIKCSGYSVAIGKE